LERARDGHDGRPAAQNPYDDPEFFAGYSRLERFGSGRTKAFDGQRLR
jgi:hypothetical protein